MEAAQDLIELKEENKTDLLLLATPKEEEIKTEHSNDVPLLEDNKNNIKTEASIKEEEAGQDVDVKQKVEAVENVGDDEGEDLPDSFFDDFSNQDFLAGLDIIDDISTEKTNRKPSSPRRNRSRDRQRRSSDRQHRRPRSRIRSPRSIRSIIYRGRFERRSRNRELRRSRDRKLRSKDKEASGVVDKDDLDGRRDPEKTKRDIQRDKIRFAKDKEAKVFQEQLKVAETGLVPPGTELDVILATERKKEDASEKVRKKEESTEAALPTRSSYGASKYSPGKRTRSRSRNRSSRRRRSRLQDRSRSRSYSPRYSRRSRRSRSHKDSKSRRNDDDLRVRLREKRKDRYVALSPVGNANARLSRSRSPTQLNSELSPGSHVSDREIWLRNKHRSRHGRSCSVISSSSLSDRDSPRRRRNKSTFFEEIQKKLSEKIPPPPQIHFDRFQQGMFPPAPPQPVPPPYQQQHQAPVENPNGWNPPIYMNDPSMFHQRPLLPNPYHGGGPMSQLLPLQPLMSLPVMQNHPAKMVPEPSFAAPPVYYNVPATPQPVPPVQQPPAPQIGPAIKPVQKKHADDNKELTKLFEEQKISLSDYLSVSAKPIDTQKPINVHKKVMVISKCQEIIQLINQRDKHVGRFFPILHVAAVEKPTEIIKWKSPLRKVVPVRLNFTTPCKKLHATDSNLAVLNKILAIAGFSQLEQQSHEPPAPAPMQIDESPPPGVAERRLYTPVPAPTVALSEAPPVLKKFRSVTTQTEPYKCQICELRKSLHFADHDTQTKDIETTDVCTQVSLDDLNKSCATFTPRGILKNSASIIQSISHLTPAQLLQMQHGNNTTTTTSSAPWNDNKCDSYPVPPQPPTINSRNSFANPFHNSAPPRMDQFSGAARPTDRFYDNNERYSPEQNFQESYMMAPGSRPQPIVNTRGRAVPRTHFNPGSRPSPWL